MHCPNVIVSCLTDLKILYFVHIFEYFASGKRMATKQQSYHEIQVHVNILCPDQSAVRL